MAMLFKLSETNRGFKVKSFKDCSGASCSIQESSSDEESKIWIGIDDADEVLLTTRMHLTRTQVRGLLPVLKKFMNTGAI